MTTQLGPYIEQRDTATPRLGDEPENWEYS